MRVSWREYLVPAGSAALACLLAIFMSSSLQSVAALRPTQGETGHECCHQALYREGSNQFVVVVGKNSNGEEAWSATVLMDANGTIQFRAEVTHGRVAGPVLRNGCELHFKKVVERPCRHLAKISERSEILSSWAFTVPPAKEVSPFKANKLRISLHSKTNAVLQSDLAGPIEKEALAKVSIHHTPTTGFAVSLAPKGPEVRIPFELRDGYGDSDFDDDPLRNAGHPFDKFCVQWVRAQVEFHVENDSDFFGKKAVGAAFANINGPFMRDLDEPVHVGFSTGAEKTARNVLLLKEFCHTPEKIISVPRDPAKEMVTEEEVRKHSRTE